MHEVIREAGLKDGGLQAAAAGQTQGWVYVIDLRTPDGPQGRVPGLDRCAKSEGRRTVVPYQET
jgi:hypothetical protein